MLLRLRLWIAAGLVCTGGTAFGEQTFVAFGLTNVTLGNAVYGSNQYYGFIYSNLGTNGTDGVSVDLGEADSAVFVYPSTDLDPATGSFMAGSLYGSVDGQTNRLICTIRCHEQSDGYHPVAIDFSPLGPTHLTFLAFRSGQLIAQSDPQADPMVVYGTYFTPYFPRVNPFWRMPDGSIGALIEFTEPAGMSLPGVGDVTADRVFIRADNPTNMVNFTSRLDITAQLPYFQIYDQRLGMFHRAHRALGGAHLRARDRTLQVANLGGDDEDGVAIEVDAAVRFDLAFAPMQLNVTDQLTILGVGNSDLGAVLGSARMARPENALELSARLEDTANHQVVVLSNGVPIGTAAGTNVVVPSSPAVVGCELHSQFTSGQPAMIVRLGQAAAVTLPDQTSVMGDEIRFTGDGRFGVIKMLALNSTGLEEFTIVSETAHSPPRPQLQVARAVDQLELSWTDPYRVFGVETARSLDWTFYVLDLPINYVGDQATMIVPVFDPRYEGAAFYRVSSMPFTPPGD
jgi:hypothetical protein